MSKKSFEHKSIDGGAAAELIDQSQELGRRGWEMVSVVYDSEARKYVAFLKRKIRHGKSAESSDDG
jgi:hypothetical protein